MGSDDDKVDASVWQLGMGKSLVTPGPQDEPKRRNLGTRVRLAVMPFDDPEVQLAELFELLVNEKFDVIPGPRTRKDATDGTDLRVDFVYDNASASPMALEATGMSLGELQASNPSEAHWSGAIDEVVRSEQLGSWIAHFGAVSNVAAVQDAVIESLRSRTGDAYYDSEGRFVLLRNESGTEDGIHYFGSTQPERVTGFSRELLVTTVANAGKLKAARPRSTHLIVLVGRNRSRDPSLTLVPPSSQKIPPLAAIDYVWVTFHTDREGLEGVQPWLWWARPGDSGWETQIGPL